MHRLLIGFVLGAAVGSVGLMFLQSLTSSGPTEPSANSDESIANGSVLEQLRVSKSRVKRVEKERDELREAIAEARFEKSPVEDPDTPGEKEESFQESALAMMMAFEKGNAKLQVEQLTGLLTERLNLSPEQEEKLKAAVAARQEAAQAHGEMIMEGKASLAQVLGGEDQIAKAFDDSLKNLLSDEQAEDYALYADERQLEKVEEKATEDMQQLQKIAGLTSEQKDQVWDVLVELNTQEVQDEGGGVPEDISMEMVNQFLDTRIDLRLEKLQPILSDAQLDSYEAQTEAFRGMMTQWVTYGMRNVEK